ncbi:unnamed protein product [Spirodela intermedia]|uniref:F-box domain-containing protein n=1 Tax=Spirodela intermedia TaxID=51605 RepID=A0A7I8JEP1_SPIIN|nr:unnamed protein product [Spirodela intermedia]CAA6668411.1 unnamed protein product [Spirodela intermedia]
MEIAPAPPPVAGAAAAADRLPEHIWEKIFSLLPVSSLVVSRSVCRGWNRAIRSETFSSFYIAATPARGDQIDDVFFLLFADLESSAPFAAAYQPSLDRWVPLPLSRFSRGGFSCGLRRVHASGGALVLAEEDETSLLVCDLFSGRAWEIAPMISSHGQSYALGLIDEGASEYQIVAVATIDRVFSQVFKSTIGAWSFKGQFWAICCSSGVEEAGDISKIVIWELNVGEKSWKAFGSMPEELLQEFRGHRMNHFYIIDRRGLVCFCNTSSYLPLMCDLRRMQWWWPRHCPFKIPMNVQTWFGHALEPQIGVPR